MPEAGTREFLVPDLGEGLEEATVVQWLVQVGDVVTLNQPLCTVETEKAEVEVPSPYAGAVVELGGSEGETLRVGTLLARIKIVSEPGSPPPVDPEAAATGAASRPNPTLVGYGHDGATDRSRRVRRGPTPIPRVAATPSRATTAGSTGQRPLAKPPVRLLARRKGVDLASIAPGSGPGGVVTRADVERACRAEPAAAPIADARGTAIPVRGVRAKIAQRMTASRAQIPDATCSVTVDCTRLLEVRAALNAHATRLGLDATVTPFSLLAHLTAQALTRTPTLNATFDEVGPEIWVHGAVHLGIGTATERGLVVTVVRDAGSLPVHALSIELARLSERARAGTASPTELQGSTFTMSNFGALGLDDGTPIINHPEAAILGVGSIKPRPHVVDGEVVARPTASFTLAFDHRVCDGAEAGQFLSDLRALVEAPELALLLS